ncbi:DUF1900-domain-containing protein [Ramicandelaber brevisporus]|nr:DUF1900-domain-containing protein [Ramicandelaber brevisporus]KAI8871676.1 DUF1900-domain-containing protein [Ramicandelaber brevisporus]
MNRFNNVSKYRNATATPAKRDSWLSLPGGSTAAPAGHASGLVSSAGPEFVAVRTSSGSIALVPHGTGVAGNPSTLSDAASSHTLSIGSGELTDFSFAPVSSSGFNPLFAAANDAGKVAVWSHSDYTSGGSGVSFAAHGRRVDSIAFNPAAEGLLATSGECALRLWNVAASPDTANVTVNVEHQVQSLSWRGDGSAVLATTKNGSASVIDPRASSAITSTIVAHQAQRTTLGAWIGNTNDVITTGFNSYRDRVVSLWDIRNPSAAIKSITLGTATAPIVPFVDPDTATLYLASRGETVVRWLSASSSLTPLADFGSCALPIPVSGGVSLLPKPFVHSMKAEIARMYVASGSNVVPVSFNVPRRSYVDFHEELFPDTQTTFASTTASDWLNGTDVVPRSISMAPVIIQKTFATGQRPAADAKISQAAAPVQPPAKPSSQTQSQIQSRTQTPTQSKSPTQPLQVGPRSAPRFKYLEGYAHHQSTHYDFISAVNTALPAEADPLHINNKFIAYAVAGPAGRINIIDRSKPGRQPNPPFGISCNAALVDFHFNPFNPNQLWTLTGDAKLQQWDIPDDVSDKDAVLSEPSLVLSIDGAQKVSRFAFNPAAENVLAVQFTNYSGASGVRIYADGKPWGSSTGDDIPSGGVLAFEWSLDGKRLAVAGRDSSIRVYTLHNSNDIELFERVGHESKRPSRIIWLSDTLLLSVGFGWGSQRELLLIDTANKGKTARTLLDPAPGIIVPHFDYDTSLLFLVDRGSTAILMYELTSDIKLNPCASPFSTGSPTLDVAFLPKKYADVRKVELLRGYRLGNNSKIETIGFKVPRKRMDLFQDDIYVPTRNIEKPVWTAAEWTQLNSNTTATFELIDLRPNDMELLSSAPVQQSIGASKLAAAAKARAEEAAAKAEQERRDAAVSNQMNSLLGLARSQSTTPKALGEQSGWAKVVSKANEEFDETAWDD